ncbi:MAG: tRNA (guanosine(46)-N7)-methyltransferase TrmB [Magnetococcales bacterium]|nr:tRNA (guanosine(46)-N7)-methyltransferase TrmB [Magnetococcales bacterium]
MNATDVNRFKVHGRKKGRLLPNQEGWLEEVLPSFLLPEMSSRQSLLESLGADPAMAKLCLEVGFGHGETLLHQAKRHPADRFVGIEVFREGIADLLKGVSTQGLNNVRVLCDHAEPLVQRFFPASSIDRVMILFPDPWPKARHHKRRLIQPRFLQVLASRMVPGGVLALATDWEHYALHMQETLAAQTAFVPEGENGLVPAPDDWVSTRYQRKGEAAGRRIFHLRYVRSKVSV